MRPWQTTFSNLEAVAQRAALAAAEELVEAAADVIADDRCNVAVLGEWSRGKSSIINALLGRQLLPVGIVPTTATVVSISHGNEDSARLVHQDGLVEKQPIEDALLRTLQTQSDGPKVVPLARVELELDLGALNDLRLIDTPGVNELSETPEELVSRLLPFVDLAVFVIDATNGGPSKTERTFIETQLQQAYRPNLLFYVNHMDRAHLESEGERAEFCAEVTEDLCQLAGDAVPVIFGTAHPEGGETTRSSISQLAERLRSRATESVAKRRRIHLRRLADALEAVVDEHLEACNEKEGVLEEAIVHLKGASTGLGRTFREFWEHADFVGRDPLKQLIGASLAGFQADTARQIEHQIALTGNVSAYAEHGLIRDLEGMIRAWVNRHLPELSTFLTRHSAFVDAEYRRTFRSGANLNVPRLPFAMPQAGVVPLVDGTAFRSSERRAAQKRYILPGLLSFAGSLIAMPVAVFGLYGGMAWAEKLRRQATEAAQAELTTLAHQLIGQLTESLREKFFEAVDHYFDDLGDQLEEVFSASLDRVNHKLDQALSAKLRGESEVEGVRLRLEAARSSLQALSRNYLSDPELRPSV